MSTKVCPSRGKGLPFDPSALGITAGSQAPPATGAKRNSESPTGPEGIEPSRLPPKILCWRWLRPLETITRPSRSIVALGYHRHPDIRPGLLQVPGAVPEPRVYMRVRISP